MLRFLIIPLAALLFTGCSSSQNESGIIMTVDGPIPAAESGQFLIHEHVLVDFIGADSIGYWRWDRRKAAAVILPYLREAKESGVNTFIDCTPAFLGRDVRLLKMLADSTGLNIVTNTGLYGADDNKYLPLYAFDASADDLAAQWTREFERGVGGSGIKPGLIKIGVNPGRLSPLHRKLITAAARTHKATGLAIASHTGPATPAFQQLDILREEGVSEDAFIWVHAQNEKNLDKHVEAAKRGAWISLDGLSASNEEEYLNMLQHLKDHKQLEKVLVSHDAGWYTPGEKNGGDFRGYTTLYTTFRDLILENGFSESDFNMIVHENPIKALGLDPLKSENSAPQSPDN